jgi:hypothetical protein
MVGSGLIDDATIYALNDQEAKRRQIGQSFIYKGNGVTHYPNSGYDYPIYGL